MAQMIITIIDQMEWVNMGGECVRMDMTVCVCVRACLCVSPLVEIESQELPASSKSL